MSVSSLCHSPVPPSVGNPVSSDQTGTGCLKMANTHLPNNSCGPVPLSMLACSRQPLQLSSPTSSSSSPSSSSTPLSPSASLSISSATSSELPCISNCLPHVSAITTSTTISIASAISSSSSSPTTSLVYDSNLPSSVARETNRTSVPSLRSLIGLSSGSQPPASSRSSGLGLLHRRTGVNNHLGIQPSVSPNLSSAHNSSLSSSSSSCSVSSRSSSISLRTRPTIGSTSPNAMSFAARLDILTWSNHGHANSNDGCSLGIGNGNGAYSRKMLRCDGCGKYYRNEYSLHHHICLKRKDVWRKGDIPSGLVDGQLVYYCPACRKPFKWLGNLTRHYYVHTGQRFFKCDICDKQFFSAYQVGFLCLLHYYFMS
ncbi:unnamed protein product [Protopolystoma xenopodis]|uniref:C2H2-type domain-containing protein n=1 Tax=Protopolystoma xenopodis TaxID=117903 RepID=A0A448WLV3_9PLAT|nr:unnamed protein product [Protopolystoma xenopodis]